MKVYKCDICGKVEPRSIRNIVARNPEVDTKSVLNSEQYYGFKLFYGDFCDDCLHKIERKISLAIYDLKKEYKEKNEEI